MWCAALLAAGGCATTTASFRTLEPAELDIAAVRSVAFMRFSGPEDLAENARAGIETKMRASGMYQVVDSSKVREQVLPQYLDQTRPAFNNLELGRRLGVDAILIGRVDQDLNFGAGNGTHRFRVGEPRIALRTKIQLIDVATGGVLAERESIQRYNGAISTTDDDIPTTAEVLDDLLAKGVDEVTGAIAPRVKEVDVELAGPTFGAAAGEIRRGNRLASDGDWVSAVTAWQEALQEDNQNHAALYNLGLAHEAAGEHERAVHFYQAALQAEDQPTYRTALTRAEQSATTHPEALAQLRRRTAMPPTFASRATEGSRIARLPMP